MRYLQRSLLDCEWTAMTGIARSILFIRLCGPATSSNQFWLCDKEDRMPRCSKVMVVPVWVRTGVRPLNVFPTKMNLRRVHGYKAWVTIEFISIAKGSLCTPCQLCYNVNWALHHSVTTVTLLGNPKVKRYVLIWALPNQLFNPPSPVSILGTLGHFSLDDLKQLLWKSDFNYIF